jgi:hypothetical protein
MARRLRTFHVEPNPGLAISGLNAVVIRCPLSRIEPVLKPLSKKTAVTRLNKVLQPTYHAIEGFGLKKGPGERGHA